MNSKVYCNIIGNIKEKGDMMQIKNILVEEKEYVMSEIERFLCVEGISYVKVDNEIHSPNLILRFYEFEEYLTAGMMIGLEQMKDPTLEDLIIINERKQNIPVDNMLGLFGIIEAEKINHRDLSVFLDVSQDEIRKQKNTPYPKMNKRKQLQLENRKYLQRLK